MPPFSLLLPSIRKCVACIPSEDIPDNGTKQIFFPPADYSLRLFTQCCRKDLENQTN